MSTTMYWRPLQEMQSARKIPTGLKLCLRAAFQGTGKPLLMTENDLPMLRAICYLTNGRDDEMAQSAEQLIALVTDHHQIELYEQS